MATQAILRIHEDAEPGATAQRPQLSRVVLAHAPRQPGSWLTWDVRQSMKPLLLACIIPMAFMLSSCAHKPALVGTIFASKADFTAAIKTRWPLRAIVSLCTTEREQSKFPVQPPLV